MRIREHHSRSGEIEAMLEDVGSLLVLFHSNSMSVNAASGTSRLLCFHVGAQHGVDSRLIAFLSPQPAEQI